MNASRPRRSERPNALRRCQAPLMTSRWPYASKIISYARATPHERHGQGLRLEIRNGGVALMWQQLHHSGLPREDQRGVRPQPEADEPLARPGFRTPWTRRRAPGGFGGRAAGVPLPAMTSARLLRRLSLRPAPALAQATRLLRGHTHGGSTVLVASSRLKLDGTWRNHFVDILQCLKYCTTSHLRPDNRLGLAGRARCRNRIAGFDLEERVRACSGT